MRKVTLKEAWEIAGRVFRDAEEARRASREAEVITDSPLPDYSESPGLSALRERVEDLARVVQDVLRRLHAISEMIEDRDQLELEKLAAQSKPWRKRT